MSKEKFPDKINRSYYDALSQIPSLFIIWFLLINRGVSLFTYLCFAVVLFSIILTIIEIFIPIAKIVENKIIVVHSVIKKPIVIEIDTIKKIVISKRGYFPVSFDFFFENNTLYKSLYYRVLSSKSLEFYELIKHYVDRAEFQEVEYVEPENKNIFLKLLNRQFSDRSLITFSTFMLLILIAIMVVTN